MQVPNNNMENTEEGMIVKRVSVPIGLEELMEGLAKEVIRNNPKDIYLFASEYFNKLLNLRNQGMLKENHARHAQSVTKQISKQKFQNKQANSIDSSLQTNIPPDLKKSLLNSNRKYKSLDNTNNKIEKIKSVLDKRKSEKNSMIDQNKSIEKSNRTLQKKTPRSRSSSSTSQAKSEDEKIRANSKTRRGENKASARKVAQKLADSPRKNDVPQNFDDVKIIAKSVPLKEKTKFRRTQSKDSVKNIGAMIPKNDVEVINGLKNLNDCVGCEISENGATDLKSSERESDLSSANLLTSGSDNTSNQIKSEEISSSRLQEAKIDRMNSGEPDKVVEDDTDDIERKKRSANIVSTVEEKSHDRQETLDPQKEGELSQNIEETRHNDENIIESPPKPVGDQNLISRTTNLENDEMLLKQENSGLESKVNSVFTDVPSVSENTEEKLNELTQKIDQIESNDAGTDEVDHAHKEEDKSEIMGNKTVLPDVKDESSLMENDNRDFSELENDDNNSKIVSAPTNVDLSLKNDIRIDEQVQETSSVTSEEKMNDTTNSMALTEVKDQSGHILPSSKEEADLKNENDIKELNISSSEGIEGLTELNKNDPSAKEAIGQKEESELEARANTENPIDKNFVQNCSASASSKESEVGDNCKSKTEKDGDEQEAFSEGDNKMADNAKEKTANNTEMTSVSKENNENFVEDEIKAAIIMKNNSSIEESTSNDVVSENGLNILVEEKLKDQNDSTKCKEESGSHIVELDKKDNKENEELINVDDKKEIEDSKKESDEKEDNQNESKVESNIVELDETDNKENRRIIDNKQKEEEANKESNEEISVSKDNSTKQTENEISNSTEAASKSVIFPERDIEKDTKTADKLTELLDGIDCKASKVDPNIVEVDKKDNKENEQLINNANVTQKKKVSKEEDIEKEASPINNSTGKTEIFNSAEAAAKSVELSEATKNDEKQIEMHDSLDCRNENKNDSNIAEIELNEKDKNENEGLTDDADNKQNVKVPKNEGNQEKNQNGVSDSTVVSSKSIDLSGNKEEKSIITEEEKVEVHDTTDCTKESKSDSKIVELNEKDNKNNKALIDKPTVEISKIEKDEQKNIPKNDSTEKNNNEIDNSTEVASKSVELSEIKEEKATKNEDKQLEAHESANCKEENKSSSNSVGLDEKNNTVKQGSIDDDKAKLTAEISKEESNEKKSIPKVDSTEKNNNANYNSTEVASLEISENNVEKETINENKNIELNDGMNSNEESRDDSNVAKLDENDNKESQKLTNGIENNQKESNKEEMKEEDIGKHEIKQLETTPTNREVLSENNGEGLKQQVDSIAIHSEDIKHNVSSDVKDNISNGISSEEKQSNDGSVKSETLPQNVVIVEEKDSTEIPDQKNENENENATKDDSTKEPEKNDEKLENISNLGNELKGKKTDTNSDSNNINKEVEEVKKDLIEQENHEVSDIDRQAQTEIMSLSVQKIHSNENDDEKMLETNETLNDSNSNDIIESLPEDGVEKALQDQDKNLDKSIGNAVMGSLSYSNDQRMEGISTDLREMPKTNSDQKQKEIIIGSDTTIEGAGKKLNEKAENEESSKGKNDSEEESLNSMNIKNDQIEEKIQKKEYNHLQENKIITPNDKTNKTVEKETESSTDDRQTKLHEISTLPADDKLEIGEEVNRTAEKSIKSENREDISPGDLADNKKDSNVLKETKSISKSKNSLQEKESNEDGKTINLVDSELSNLTKVEKSKDIGDEAQSLDSKKESDEQQNIAEPLDISKQEEFLNLVVDAHQSSNDEIKSESNTTAISKDRNVHLHQEESKNKNEMEGSLNSAAEHLEEKSQSVETSAESKINDDKEQEKDQKEIKTECSEKASDLSKGNSTTEEVKKEETILDKSEQQVDSVSNRENGELISKEKSISSKDEDLLVTSDQNKDIVNGESKVSQNEISNVPKSQEEEIDSESKKINENEKNMDEVNASEPIKSVNGQNVNDILVENKSEVLGKGETASMANNDLSSNNMINEMDKSNKINKTEIENDASRDIIEDFNKVEESSNITVDHDKKLEKMDPEVSKEVVELDNSTGNKIHPSSDLVQSENIEKTVTQETPNEKEKEIKTEKMNLNQGQDEYVNSQIEKTDEAMVGDHEEQGKITSLDVNVVEPLQKENAITEKASSSEDVSKNNNEDMEILQKILEGTENKLPEAEISTEKLDQTENSGRLEEKNKEKNEPQLEKILKMATHGKLENDLKPPRSRNNQEKLVNKVTPIPIDLPKTTIGKNFTSKTKEDIKLKNTRAKSLSQTQLKSKTSPRDTKDEEKLKRASSVTARKPLVKSKSTQRLGPTQISPRKDETAEAKQHLRKKRSSSTETAAKIVKPVLTKSQSTYDSSKLREELKQVEKESKLHFKPSYNPYILRQEIKKAAKQDDKDFSGVAARTSAALKIQSLWRGFVARRQFKEKQTKKMKLLDDKENKQDVTNKEDAIKTKKDDLVKLEPGENNTTTEKLEKEINEEEFIKKSQYVENMEVKSDVIDVKTDENRSQSNESIEDKITKSDSAKNESIDEQTQKMNVDVEEGNSKNNEINNNVHDPKLEVTENKERQLSMAEAVVKIQTLWRGFNIRRLKKRGDLFGHVIEKENKIVEDLQTTTKVKAKLRSALKIQAAWRGYKVRKNIKEVNQKLAELQQPSECDELPNQRGPSVEDIMRAATKIQAGVRGFMVRRKNKSMLPDIKEENQGDKMTDKDIENALRKLMKVHSDSPSLYLPRQKTVDEPPCTKKFVKSLSSESLHKNLLNKVTHNSFEDLENIKDTKDMEGHVINKLDEQSRGNLQDKNKDLTLIMEDEELSSNNLDSKDKIKQTPKNIKTDIKNTEDSSKSETETTLLKSTVISDSLVNNVNEQLKNGEYENAPTRPVTSDIIQDNINNTLGASNKDSPHQNKQSQQSINVSSKKLDENKSETTAVDLDSEKTERPGSISRHLSTESAASVDSVITVIKNESGDLEIEYKPSSGDQRNRDDTVNEDDKLKNGTELDENVKNSVDQLHINESTNDAKIDELNQKNISNSTLNENDIHAIGNLETNAETKKDSKTSENEKINGPKKSTSLSQFLRNLSSDTKTSDETNEEKSSENQKENINQESQPNEIVIKSETSETKASKDESAEKSTPPHADSPLLQEEIDKFNEKIQEILTADINDSRDDFSNVEIDKEIADRPNLDNKFFDHHRLAATKIQSTYRGYRVRRDLRDNQSDSPNHLQIPLRELSDIKEEESDSKSIDDELSPKVKEGEAIRSDGDGKENTSENNVTNDNNTQKSAEVLSTTTINLVHTGEFHDTITVPLPITPPQQSSPTTRGNERNGSPPGLRHTGEMHDSVLPVSNQTNQAPPAGASILTSSKSNSYKNDDSEAAAQASNKDASTCATETDTESSTTAASMESEKRNNATNTIPKKNMEVEAATKIQAGFRGYQVRKQLKNKIGASSDNTNQRRTTRRKSSGRLTDSNRMTQIKSKNPSEIEEKSAVKIQAGIRGFLVRRRQQKKEKSNKDSS